MRDRLEVVACGARLDAAAREVVRDHERAVRAVRDALAPLEDAEVRRQLGAVPVARLQEVSREQLRVGSVERGGLETVGQVLDAGADRLRQLPGIGDHSAGRIVRAAREFADAVRGTVAVRIDVDRPEPGTDDLLMALYVLVEAGPDAWRAVGRAVELTGRLGPLLVGAEPGTGLLRMLVAGQDRRARARAAVSEIRSLVAEAERGDARTLFARVSVDLLRRPPAGIAARVDFELRSAEYYGLLAEVSGRLPDASAARGHLPDEIAERVGEQPLDDSHCRVALRGYQEFGARFALARRKAIVGDEMGLGKTVQAVAVLAHLAAEGHRRFLVVCPASVLVNWVREIEARSTLRAVLLHGPDRHAAYARWRERGGVGVATFDALRSLPEGPVALGAFVVDEAHRVKNPGALRSQAVARWAAACDRVLFLTGTPMENRVAEFRNLVRMLDPAVAEVLGGHDALVGSAAFRRAVAPVYLRRNQEDVLAELPSLQRTDEWEELSASDEDAYREAVRSGNFMAMRRAAYARPEKSAKLRRLVEIVREAGESGQKTVVFSCFKDVLGVAGQALGGRLPGGTPVFGPLDGGVDVGRRQRTVDGFTGTRGPAVLLAQIQTAGLGLNLQAASVVVLCEPQVTPTAEHQAIARAHRMGQVRPVQVHRILATGGVDARVVELLENKDRLFDAYARRSAVAEAEAAHGTVGDSVRDAVGGAVGGAVHDSVDSVHDSVRDAVDAVHAWDGGLARRIVEAERERLGVGGRPKPGPYGR
ncbi:DEAD/DEAH box helicase [Streptomyces sp. NPDC050504]|uniref:DEAD/DEAH box helicase n=1 Tax=Streptomyces sp. NPDC050504 TaxID=3365618 RepID=UPI00379BF081